MNIKHKIVSPVLMWLIVLIGFFGIEYFVPARFVFSRSIFLKAWIVPAFLYWLYFFFGAISVHYKAPLSADKIDKLITWGVYAKMRHPIYSADIILGWSIFFFYPDVRFLIGAHWMMFVLLFWMRREEQVLIEKFGDEYRAYISRVPKIFPKL
jgi:protein-S-isoprenylcysteine O-methyltransferase Ste14